MHIFYTTVETRMFLPYTITLYKFYSKSNIYYMHVVQYSSLGDYYPLYTNVYSFPVKFIS